MVFSCLVAVQVPSTQLLAPYTEPTPPFSLNCPVIITVQIKETGMNRLILFEALLKPIVPFPEIIIRPVDDIFSHAGELFLAAAEIGNQFEKVRHIFNMQIEKNIRIGSDKAADEVGLILFMFEGFILGKGESNAVMPAVDHEIARKPCR